jgi:CDP-diacylglycerol--glycerol-3-phosphate 3-phosphatidyltransferase
LKGARQASGIKRICQSLPKLPDRSTGRSGFPVFLPSGPEKPRRPPYAPTLENLPLAVDKLSMHGLNERTRFLSARKSPPMNDMDQPNGWLKRLPNKLTLARIAAIPFLLIVYPLDFRFLNIFCAVVFAFAALTDYLDGYLARKYESVTPLGALLDPIADKMLVAAALVLLAHAKNVPPLLAGILICRDIGVSGLRLLALEQRLTIEVSDFGKWKTVLQDIAIVCLMINEPLFDLPLRAVGMLTLWGAVALSLYSAWTYGRSFWEKAKTELFG